MDELLDVGDPGIIICQGMSDPCPLFFFFFFFFANTKYPASRAPERRMEEGEGKGFKGGVIEERVLYFQWR
jgi:hypothetical protein